MIESLVNDGTLEQAPFRPAMPLTVKFRLPEAPKEEVMEAKGKFAPFVTTIHIEKAPAYFGSMLSKSGYVVAPMVLPGAKVRKAEGQDPDAVALDSGESSKAELDPLFDSTEEDDVSRRQV